MRKTNSLSIKLRKKYTKQFIREIKRENYDKLSIGSLVFFVIEIVMYFTGKVIDFPKEVVLQFDIWCVFVVPLMFFIRHKRLTDTIFADIVIYTYIGSVMMLGTYLAVLQIGIRDSIYIYVMFLTIVISFMTLKPISSAMVISWAYAVFMAVCYTHNVPWSTMSVLFLNMTAMHIMSWLISGIMFRMKYQMFLDHELLIEKNSLLEQLAITDRMTCVNNHESICLQLQESMKVADKQGYYLSIAMFDIDNFKHINDTYGHLTGDTILKRFSNIIKNCIREYDTVGRFGGDEFLVIFKRADKYEAASVVERIKMTAIGDKWPNRMKIRFSCGISQYAGEDIEKLIESADDKLYYVKRHGKNNYLTDLTDLTDLTENN